jgi:hypothetical protein
MSLVKIQGNASGTGEFTIAAPNSNTNRTLTLPDNTGTIITTASTNNYPTGPSFSAYKSSTQTPTSATFTKVTFENEEWDTNSNFASSRFTPTVAGYYLINSTLNFGLNTGLCLASIYKNGSEHRRGLQISVGSAGNYVASVSSIVYLNGSTDYVEIYIYLGSATAIDSTQGRTYFDGAMVRTA